MLRKFSARSSPKHAQPPAALSNSSSKPKSQTLIICSAALSNVAAATKLMPPEAPIIRNIAKDSDGYHDPLQAELLPPETVISILDGFAERLLVDKEMFAQLKSKCIEGTKLGHGDNRTATVTSCSILKSSHTVLTYLSWGIRHMEKAAVEKEKREEHLTNAEQMLKSLIDSMQQELNDHPTALWVPNTDFVLGLAHVLLALVWKMRKNTSKYVAFHMLEAFLVSPRDARQTFIPDLWSLLFCNHLQGVERWYQKEQTNIIRSFSISSISPSTNPRSPSSTRNTVSSVTANAAVARAHTLMDLVAGMRSSKRATNSTCNEGVSVQNEYNQSKLLEKMNMKVNFLSNLYEQSLDEGTIQCARHYQDLITSYYGRFSVNRTSKKQTMPPSSDDQSQKHATGTGLTTHYNQEKVESNIPQAGALESGANVGHENVDSKVISGGGWMGTNALQLRRSLYDAIFGTVAIQETSKKNRNSTPSASSQVASLLQICSNQLPKVLDPLRPKEEAYNNACTDAVTCETSNAQQSAANKPATIRDFVNIAFSPEAKEESPFGSFTSILTPNKTAPIINHDSLNVPYQESDTSLTTTLELRELSPACDDQQTVPHETSAVKGNAQSKRLIDYIKGPNHISEAICSSALSHEEHKAVHPLCKTSQQRRISLNIEGTKIEEARIIKRSNSERSAPAKHQDRGRVASNEQEIKRKMTTKVTSTRRASSSRSEVLLGTSSRHRKKVEEATDVQVKYCTSVQMHQTRSFSTNNVKVQLKETSNKNASSQALSPLEAEVQQGEGVMARQICDHKLKELANELRAVVQAARSSGSTQEGVGRCEEVLLKLSEAWLECKSTTLLQKNKDGDSASSDHVTALEEVTEELLFILANSELQEAQRLALCLLSASSRSCLNPTIKPQWCDYSTEKGERHADSQLPTNPNIWQALSHLLQQQGRLPEAALLLHLHPAQYSASCHHFLPHLLPLLLDLAQRNNIPPPANSAFHHVPDSYNPPFHGRLRLFGDSLKPRALALMMMSRLLAVVDGVTRLQACKHVLFPNVNALPCLLHSLDYAPSLDERAAAAFILTTCMQADHTCRQHITTHVKLTTVVALLQHSASNSSAFQTSVTFVTELIRTRKENITEMLGCIRQDGLLNCMHALMAYLQTSSIENKPPAAGLLFQLDLLLGDEKRYSVFREEALEALLAPILSESNQRASFTAAGVLSTIGRSHSEQELEAWLLKKAGLGGSTCQSINNSSQYCRSTAAKLPLKDEEEEHEEEESSRVEWDERVARALLQPGSGGLVSAALAKGLQSSMAEVRKTCLLVAAWLTAHLSKMHHLDGAQYKACKLVSATAKERMRVALQAQLQKIAAVNSGSAIVERVFAALALQNLTR